MTQHSKPEEAAEERGLTLFVAGATGASRAVQGNLESILEELKITLRPTIVDVLLEPEQALKQSVFVTPALVVKRQRLREMIVGDLSRRGPVIAMLRALL